MTHAAKSRVTLLQGDCRTVLKTLPSNSVDCVVSSPPYWRQRDYGSGGKWIVERGHAWNHAKGAKGWRKPPAGYKDKDLVGIPWMFAFAVRAEGWFLRQCNIWAKPNCMPESVADRSTVAHEYVFHLTKNNDYWYDSKAARVPAAPGTQTRLSQHVRSQRGSKRANAGAKTNGRMKAVGNINSANLRSVWWISPAQYRDGHYAVMPDRIAEICISAGCPPEGTVVDPFGGAGTTGLVASRLGRHAILIDLNPKYVEMARRRIEQHAPLFTQVKQVDSADNMS